MTAFLPQVFVLAALISPFASGTTPKVECGLENLTAQRGYEKQDRGDAAAYARYFAGMEKTSMPKMALGTAYLPVDGVVLDMGSGSGRSSFDFANLYPRMTVIGIDNNPKTVALARKQYVRPNLSFREGDVAGALFPPQSVDGIFNSSTNHHVTTLVILELVNEDGLASGPVEKLSTAALFETRFVKDFKSSVHRTGGVPFKKLPPVRPGFSRFEVDLRTAHEFVLHKDYRTEESQWKAEVQEEYTYLDQKGFEAEHENAAAEIPRRVTSRSKRRKGGSYTLTWTIFQMVKPPIACSDIMMVSSTQPGMVENMGPIRSGSIA